MTTLFKQELYKLIKRRSTWVCIVGIMLIATLLAITSKLYPQHFIPRELFVSNYAADTLVALLLIGSAASIISSEYQYNTMKNIVCQIHSRPKILLAKWLLLFTYSMFLYLWFSGFAYFNKVIFFRNDYSLTSLLRNQKTSLWEYWIETIFSNFLTTWLVLSVVLLISALFKKSNLAITVGVVGCFAITIIGKVTAQLIQRWHFLKWNPINLLNYSAQIAQPAMQKITGLNLDQLFVGNLIYIILFMIVGMWLFSNKEI